MFVSAAAEHKSGLSTSNLVKEQDTFSYFYFKMYFSWQLLQGADL